MMKVSKLCNKDVVDIKSACKLGRIKDVDIDIESGKINSFDVVLNLKASNFFKNKSKIQILWEDVENIGDEVILVKNKNN